MLKLTMQQIMYFLDLCRTLNFTETAKKNYLSQPTLSRQISILEEKVGTQLFLRNHRNVSLTPEGALLQKEFLSFIQQYDHMVESVTQIANHKTGSLKIFFSEFLNMNTLCENYIYPFQKKYPLIQLTCECLSYEKIKKQLLENESDIFFLPGYEMDSFCGYESMVVANEPVGIVLARNNPLFFLDDLSPELLNGKNLILLNNRESSAFTRRALAVCQKLGVSPGNLLYTQNISSMIVSLQCGLGFTVTNSYIAQNYSELLKSFQFEQCFPEKIYALWSTKSPNFALKIFTDSLIENSNNSDN